MSILRGFDREPPIDYGAPKPSPTTLAEHLHGQHDQKKHGHKGHLAPLRPFEPIHNRYIQASELDRVATERAALRAPADRAAANAYQSYGWYDAINEPLRQGTLNADEISIHGYPGGYNFGVARGTPIDMSNEQAVARIDKLMTSEGGLPFDAVLYRGLADPAVFGSGNLVGTSFSDRAFCSTSGDYDTALAFVGQEHGILIDIPVRQGHPALVLDSEVVLPRDQEFVITADRTQPNGMRLLTMEPVG